MVLYHFTKLSLRIVTGSIRHYRNMSKFCTTEDVAKFWFEETTGEQHWKKDDAFDAMVRERFHPTWEMARNRGYLETASGEETAMTALGQIILFDQFPRNMFRNKPESFSTDPHARETLRRALSKGWDKQLPSGSHRMFLLMPLMHSERKEDQELSVQMFGADDHYAVAHKKIVDDWGRFPHRNAILQRESTAAEKEFLEKPGSSF